MPWATNTELFMFIATINSPAITLFICRIHLVCTITINYPIEVLTAILLTSVWKILLCPHLPCVCNAMKIIWQSHLVFRHMKLNRSPQLKGHRHWIEKHGIELPQDDWLIMVIEQRYSDVQSSCCPVTAAIFWQRYVMFWPTPNLLHYNWSCCLERFYMGKLTWTETPLANQMKVRGSTSCTQCLPSACQG